MVIHREITGNVIRYLPKLSIPLYWSHSPISSLSLLISNVSLPTMRFLSFSFPLAWSWCREATDKLCAICWDFCSPDLVSTVWWQAEVWFEIFLHCSMPWEQYWFPILFNSLWTLPNIPEIFREICGFLKNGTNHLLSWYSFTVLCREVMFGRKKKQKKARKQPWIL